MRTDRWSVLHLPRPRSEAEIRGGERTNRTNIGGITREMTVETRIRKSNDLERASSLIKADYWFTYQLILKTCTSSALNATFTVKENKVTQRYSFLQLHFFIEEIT